MVKIKTSHLASAKYEFSDLDKSIIGVSLEIAASQERVGLSETAHQIILYYIKYSFPVTIQTDKAQLPS